MCSPIRLTRPGARAIKSGCSPLYACANLVASSFAALPFLSTPRASKCCRASRRAARGRSLWSPLCIREEGGRRGDDVGKQKPTKRVKKNAGPSHDPSPRRRPTHILHMSAEKTGCVQQRISPSLQLTPRNFSPCTAQHRRFPLRRSPASSDRRLSAVLQTLRPQSTRLGRLSQGLYTQTHCDLHLSMLAVHC